MSIPRLQTKTKHIFNICDGITSLKQYHVGAENLDILIMIQKNWPSNIKCDCRFASKGVEDFFCSWRCNPRGAQRYALEERCIWGLMCNNPVLLLEKEYCSSTQQEMWNLKHVASYFLECSLWWPTPTINGISVL